MAAFERRTGGTDSVLVYEDSRLRLVTQDDTWYREARQGQATGCRVSAPALPAHGRCRSERGAPGTSGMLGRAHDGAPRKLVGFRLDTNIPLAVRYLELGAVYQREEPEF